MTAAAGGGGSGAPRIAPWSIIALAGLVLLVLLAVLVARLTGYEPAPPPPAAVVESRELLFRDGADGSVLVLDGASENIIARYASGDGSFLRGVMRSLVRQRRVAEVTGARRFLLTRHSDGRLRITDPQTDQAIDLGAFGPDNAAVFARLLAAAEAPTGPQPDG